MSRVVGIDEAGRGPVLGPLVIGVVEWDPVRQHELESRDLKLRDSKKMTPDQRSRTYRYLTENLRYCICSIPAWVIAKPGESIPQIEARVINRALRNFGSRDVYCDALGSGNQAHNWIRNEFPERSFRFESGADDTYPAVSAASILAKETRDRAIDFLKGNWGDIGSGYPSDPSTRQWLENWDHGSDWPSFVRTNWSTVHSLTG